LKIEEMIMILVLFVQVLGLLHLFLINVQKFKNKTKQNKTKQNKTKQNKRPLELTNLDAWGSERLKNQPKNIHRLDLILPSHI
jgi:sortase (surface protein transpeptidase)